jgi:hypothetical protein
VKARSEMALLASGISDPDDEPRSSLCTPELPGD